MSACQRRVAGRSGGERCRCRHVDRLRAGLAAGRAL